MGRRSIQLDLIVLPSPFQGQEPPPLSLAGHSWQPELVALDRPLSPGWDEGPLGPYVVLGAGEQELVADMARHLTLCGM